MECASGPGVIAARLPAASFAGRGRGGADRSHRAVPSLRRPLRSLGRHALGSVLAGLAVLVIGAPEQATAQTPNTPATGAPTITGTAQVGQTLTASPGTIADADGLTTPNYTYQWIRVDGTDEADLTDKTFATYTMNNADLGKTLKVRASFTDDAGNAESRTSAPTATVEYGAPTALSVTVGVGQVVLVWRRPVAGGLAFAGYEYRYSAGGMILPTAMWQPVQSPGSIRPEQAYFSAGDGSDERHDLYLPGSYGSQCCQERAGDRDRDTSITAVLHHRRAARGRELAHSPGCRARPSVPPACDPVAPRSGPPTLGDRRLLWQGQLTAGVLAVATDGNIDTGYGEGGTETGTLTPDTSFSFRSADYEVFVLTAQEHLNIAINQVLADVTWYPRDEVVDALRLHVCNTPYDFSSAGRCCMKTLRGGRTSRDPP